MYLFSTADLYTKACVVGYTNQTHEDWTTRNATFADRWGADLTEANLQPGWVSKFPLFKECAMKYKSPTEEYYK